MPKDPSLHKILVIGSGSIVIGQGCEFDCSGVQACKALKEEGYTVILVNSNPATIMTDPEFAHRTYIEPITPQIVELIIEREKPDALRLADDLARSKKEKFFVVRKRTETRLESEPFPFQTISFP